VKIMALIHQILTPQKTGFNSSDFYKEVPLGSQNIKDF
jgi:hypothetical protein